MRGIRGRFAWHAAASAIRCQRTVRGSRLIAVVSSGEISSTPSSTSFSIAVSERGPVSASRTTSGGAGRGAERCSTSSTSPPPTTRAVQIRPSGSATSTSSPGRSRSTRSIRRAS